MTMLEVKAKAVEDCRRFLKSLAQTVKLVSLYQAGHPVTVSAVQEGWHLLQELFAETGWPELSLGVVDGRWVVNGKTLSDPLQTYELLALVLRSHSIEQLVFQPEVRGYELSALCELAATPPNRAYSTDAAEELKERGVRHIRANVDAFVRARRVKPQASSLIESPIPRAPAAASAPALAPQAAPAAPADGKSFGSTLKGLVEASVKDPQERAQIYGELVGWVREALSRHASESSLQARQETQVAINERQRAERVFSKVAEGKIVVDKDGRVLMMDPVAEEILGKPLRHAAGKPILESLSPGERVLALAQDLETAQEGAAEVSIAGSDEVLSSLRQSVAVVHDEQGRMVGTCAVPPYAAKLREAAQLQEDFMSNVTHDLKAPLASICAALEMLRNGSASKLTPEDARFLDISVRNSLLLKHMITELLDFSKLGAGRMTLHPGPTEVKPLLSESVESLSPWAASKKITLELSRAPDRLPRVLADGSRIVEVLNNLISNAIKSTPEGGRIWVSAEPGTGPQAGLVVFCVRDTGCGISEKDQALLFERFSQVRAKGARREGVGLGLAIAKEIVTLHQGKLWLDSALGAGSRFYFSLPEAGSA